MKQFVMLTAVVLVMAAALLPQSSAAQTGNARVRVMHASPNAPAVDVYVNGNKTLSNVPFFALSNYLSVPAGSYRIQVTPADAAASSAVIDATLSFAAGRDYTVAAVNTVDKIEAIVLNDDNSAPSAGRARVRVLHASPDAPAVDIKPAGTTTAAISGAAFKNSAYIEVPKGIYNFDITPAGSSTAVFTTPDLRFESGWVYTLVATGELGKGGFWVQARTDRIAP